MAGQFNTLFSVSVEHEFYGGLCPDFSFLWTEDSINRLKRGRLVGKMLGGSLHCFYATDNDDAPLVDLSGEKLLIALKLNNPYFSHFTDYDQTGRIAFYANDSNPQALSLKHRVKPVGSLLTQAISLADRPLVIRLTNSSGSVVDTQTVEQRSQTECHFNLQAQEPGLLLITELYSTGSRESYYYHDAALNKTGVFALIEISLSDALYQNAGQFNIHFNAREETLKYYVIAKNYSDSDFSQLAVTDQGFSEQSRSRIEFTRVASNDFTADEIDIGLLGDGDDKIALFKSQTPVKRRQAAFKRLQLVRNGDLLIANLPVPAQDKVRADFIIHLARP